MFIHVLSNSTLRGEQNKRSGLIFHPSRALPLLLPPFGSGCLPLLLTEFSFQKIRRESRTCITNAIVNCFMFVFYEFSLNSTKWMSFNVRLIMETRLWLAGSVRPWKAKMNPVTSFSGRKKRGDGGRGGAWVMAVADKQVTLWEVKWCGVIVFFSELSVKVTQHLSSQ